MHSVLGGVSVQISLCVGFVNVNSANLKGVLLISCRPLYIAACRAHLLSIRILSLAEAFSHAFFRFMSVSTKPCSGRSKEPGRHICYYSENAG